MPRYVAFLRAINVGGHTAKMADLIAVCESLGLTGVESFLASGNLIFTAGKTSPSTLEKKIATALEERLGFAVATFLRTGKEVEEILRYRPFSAKLLSEASALNIGFTGHPFSKEEGEIVQQFRTPMDEFHLRGREIYWLCRQKQSESHFNGGKLERAIGREVTFRSASSLSKLVTRLMVQSS